MDGETLDRNLKKVIEQARDLNIPVPYNISEHVIVNPRPKKRFGCCRRNERGFDIEISRFVLECDDSVILCVLAHEVLHTCGGCYDHGKIWKMYARAMNDAYGYDIKRTSSFEDAGLNAPEERTRCENVKYIIKCRRCGKEYPRRRCTKTVRNIHRYRCTCGGRLTVMEKT